MNSSLLSHRYAQVFLAYCLVSIPLGLMLFWIPIPVVHASSMTVTTLDDTIAADGFCSLREAMTNANNNDQSGSTECTAGTAGLDTITFSVVGTITLGSQLPAITETLTINGPGASLLTISGNNLLRIMAVNAGTLNLSNVTLANGNAIDMNGGAIRNNATLSVTNTTFYSNTTNSNGGAVHNGGTASIANSTFISNSSPISLTGGYGGAINNGAGAISLMITNTTFYTNSAAIVGGGVRVGTGTATIVNSTFSGNLTGGYGGAIDGGAGSTLLITNTTFYTNSAAISGGGINVGIGSVAIATSTFSGNTAPNGGGIVSGNGGTLSMTNTNFYSNTASTGGGFINYLGTANITGTNFYSNTATTGGGIYNSTSGTLTVTSGTLTGNHSTSGGGLVNDGGLSIISNTAFLNNIASSGSGGGGILNINNGTLTLLSSNFSSNSAVGSNGGGISLITGTLTVSNTYFYSNTTSNQGGGISNYPGGILNITNSRFYSNTATTLYGGGIDNWFGTLTIAGTTFTSNAASYGGGIANEGGTSSGVLSITNSTIVSNTASSAGGGIANGGSLTMTNTTVAGNFSVGSMGGGIYRFTGPVLLRNSIVSSNPSGGNCSGTITNGGNNIDDGATCGWGSSNGSMSSSNPLLGAVANNGGTTQTMALLPGSPAIDGATFSAPNGCPSTDQRGVARPQNSVCDIGAFESHGFTLAITGGNNQSAYIFKPYTLPLSITVSSGFGEPVNGGVVTFTAPASGASAALGVITATIASSVASTTATANSVPGSFNVIAATKGSSPVQFALTNLVRSLLPLIVR